MTKSVAWTTMECPKCGCVFTFRWNAENVEFAELLRKRLQLNVSCPECGIRQLGYKFKSAYGDIGFSGLPQPQDIGGVHRSSIENSVPDRRNAGENISDLQPQDIGAGSEPGE